ncbi:MAG: hypothetical protein IKI38_04980 [Mogibacterium sp.]|nr:hypothetical protein [Mogibacterium sp.]
MAIYNNGNQNGVLDYKLVEQLGVIDTHKSGWSREVNLVAWNGKPPKFDIRDWDPDHERMSRGITLHEKEAIKLAKILVKRLQMDEIPAQSAEACMQGNGSYAHVHESAMQYSSSQGELYESDDQDDESEIDEGGDMLY